MFKTLLRTIPTLSGNVTLNIRLHELTMNDKNVDIYDSYPRAAGLIPLQNTLYNKLIDVSLLNGQFEFDIKKFYKYYSDTFYSDNFSYNRKDYQKIDITGTYPNNNRNKDYEFGCKRQSFSQTGYQFNFYAPFYIDDIDSIPDYFDIDIQLSEYVHRTIRVHIGDNKDDKRNYLYNYIKRYVEKIDDNVVYMLHDSNQGTYYGIDCENGGLVQLKDNVIGSIYNRQTTINNFDYIINSGFSRNKLIISQVIPISFSFNMSDLFDEDRQIWFYKAKITGAYYKDGVLLDTYDFSIDYKDFRGTINSVDILSCNVTNKLSDQNVMDVQYPGLQEMRYKDYKFTNKITPNYNRWKLKYSSDEDPYITNINYAFSYATSYINKYGEFPLTNKFYKTSTQIINSYLQIFNNDYANDQNIKETEYDIDKFQSDVNYRNYMIDILNNINSWYELTDTDDIEHSYKSLNWGNVKDNCIYYKGILYDLNNEISDLDIKVDKFGIFLKPNMSIIENSETTSSANSNSNIYNSKYVITNDNITNYDCTINPNLDENRYDKHKKASIFFTNYSDAIKQSSHEKDAEFIEGGIMKRVDSSEPARNIDYSDKYVLFSDYYKYNCYYNFRKICDVLKNIKTNQFKNNISDKFNNTLIETSINNIDDDKLKSYITAIIELLKVDTHIEHTEVPAFVSPNIHRIDIGNIYESITKTPIDFDIHMNGSFYPLYNKDSNGTSIDNTGMFYDVASKTAYVDTSNTFYLSEPIISNEDLCRLKDICKSKISILGIESSVTDDIDKLANRIYEYLYNTITNNKNVNKYEYVPKTSSNGESIKNIYKEISELKDSYIYVDTFNLDNLIRQTYYDIQTNSYICDSTSYNNELNIIEKANNTKNSYIPIASYELYDFLKKTNTKLNNRNKLTLEDVYYKKSALSIDNRSIVPCSYYESLKSTGLFDKSNSYLSQFIDNISYYIGKDNRLSTVYIKGSVVKFDEYLYKIINSESYKKLDEFIPLYFLIKDNDDVELNSSEKIEYNRNETVYVPIYGDTFKYNTTDFILNKNKVLNNFHVVKDAEKDYYVYKKYNAPCFISYNLLPEIPEYRKQFKNDLYKMYDSNKVMFRYPESGKSLSKYLSYFKKDNKIYAYYLLNVNINNTIYGMYSDRSSLLYDNIFTGIEYKYPVYDIASGKTIIRNRKISIKNHDILEYFNYLVPYFVSSPFTIFIQQIKSIILPTQFNLIMQYKTATINKEVSNESRSSFTYYDRISHKQNTNTELMDIQVDDVAHKKLNIIRYTNKITPYIYKTHYPMNIYELIYKDSIEGFGSDNLICRNLNIYNYPGIRTVSVKYINGEKQLIYDDVHELEYKYFNDNHIWNLPGTITIPIKKSLTYDELIDRESYENTIKEFKKYIKKINKNALNENQLLFLYNKYKVRYISDPIKLNISKSFKLYKLIYKFELI